jgi:hypothetical protein
VSDQQRKNKDPRIEHKASATLKKILDAAWQGVIGNAAWTLVVFIIGLLVLQRNVAIDRIR